MQLSRKKSIWQSFTANRWQPYLYGPSMWPNNVKAIHFVKGTRQTIEPVTSFSLVYDPDVSGGTAYVPPPQCNITLNGICSLLYFANI